MARFEIKTPVPSWNGVSAGVAFANGRAVITSDTASGLAALRYFRESGYGIAPLDEPGVDEVLVRANEDPQAEHARLVSEIRGKEARLELDELRARNKELDDKVFKADSTSAEDEPQTGNVGGTQPELLAPPAESAGVGAWRTWAVDSGRVTADEAKTLDKATIVDVHGSAYDSERAAQLKLAAEQGGAA